MNWIQLTEENQLDQINEESKNGVVAIFKHSTRCSISAMAKMRLERAEAPDNIKFYYLDLLQYRPISAKVAELYDVVHESPQILLIRNGECIYDESHNGIEMDDIKTQAAA
jgi:bacillithiol system protein YtxJ